MVKILHFLVFVMTIPTLATAFTSGPYWGFKVMGNDQFCAVYSDHPYNDAGQTGLQHLYIGDYSNDYVASTTVELNGQPLTFGATGSEPYFAAKSVVQQAHFRAELNVFPLLEADILVFELLVTNLDSQEQRFEPRMQIRWRQEPQITQTNDEYDWKIYDFGEHVLASHYSQPQSELKRAVLPNQTLTCTWLLLIDPDEATIPEQVTRFSTERNLLEAAAEQWDAWLDKGLVPTLNDPELTDFYKTNLVAIKGVNLNGHIPADVTGQFLTNGMPQLYPRDAMMTARCFLETGHFAEARQIVNFWNDIPTKSPGEWYARYDAHGQPVDGGSGARYDVPEWDSNGYYATLIRRYHDLTGEWIGDEQRLWEALDFIEPHLSDNGLLEEGGIIEWVGYLPATNMNIAAGLWDGALIATQKGDTTRANRYREVAAGIAENLGRMYDPQRNAFFDGRDGRMQFNTSANFGYIWGYHRPEALDWLRSTNRYYHAETTQMDGGVKYFDAEGYGDDLFGFTTAAAAQYHAFEGDAETYFLHLNWLKDHANAYGLMPERVHFPEETRRGVAEASPLSWCNGEFVMAIVAGAQAGLFGSADDGQRAMQTELNILRENGIVITPPEATADPLEQYVSIWTQCIDILTHGDALQQHRVGNLERLARRHAKKALGLQVRTNIQTKNVTGQKELIYGVEIQHNGTHDVVGAWRQRPFFHPEKPLWGVPQDLVTPEKEPVLQPGQIRVAEIEVQRLTENLNFDWKQRVGLEYLAYVSPQHALVYPAWVYLQGQPPLTLDVERVQPGEKAVLTIGNQCDFRLEQIKLAITGPFSAPIDPNLRLAAGQSTQISIAIPEQAPIGNYPVFVNASTPDGRTFEAKTVLEIVRYIDLSGMWDFYVGDLSEQELPKVLRHSLENDYARGRHGQTDAIQDYAYDRSADGAAFWARWEKIEVPAQWEEAGHPDLDGVCWYRKTFNASGEWQRDDVWLEVGAIDDNDVTYLNGQHVGEVAMWNQQRLYRLTPALNWQHPNVLAIKVIDLGYGGGIWKAPVRLVITGR